MPKGSKEGEVDDPKNHSKKIIVDKLLNYIFKGKNQKEREAILGQILKEEEVNAISQSLENPLEAVGNSNEYEKFYEDQDAKKPPGSAILKQRPSYKEEDDSLYFPELLESTPPAQ